MNVRPIVPILLNATTAYLAGVIVGDGHINGGTKSRNSSSLDYGFVVEIAEEEYAHSLLQMFQEVVRTEARVRTVVARKTPLFNIKISNKSLFHFFVNRLGIPTGAKSRIVKIPEEISSGSSELKRAFLAGLFDTDGGLRGNRIGYTTASRCLREGVIGLLKELDFICYADEWVNKKYERSYFGIRLSTHGVDRFLNELPLKNQTKKQKIALRFMRRCRSGQTGQV